ncbi:MAG: AAA family ATPase, partial [Clostridia bacterium]|nr:AAA family ATPase [Clostridia bacterium]
MKVRRICCTQFAGLNEKSLSLEDGINILYGKNESGKSTFVHLLSRTLFQNAKLDKRTDRDFRQLYFPAPHADHRTPGDFIDGSVTLETEDGLYTLRKEWGEDPRCTLSTPDAILRSPQQIDETLRRILEYGEGVYGEILLSSQRNTLPALSALLDPGSKSDARTEILTAVTAAFAETGALSVDAIGQAIQEKTEAIAGKHWDAEAGKPQRKAGSGRWASG